MNANQTSFPVATMARVLGVSKAGFYAWLPRPPSAYAVADAALLKRVRTVHASSRQTYGSPRVHAELRTRGEKHSRKRIARLMREAGLVGACHRHGGPTTTVRDKDARPAPDLVDRNFTASGPNQLWVADITLTLSANSGGLCQGGKARHARFGPRPSIQPVHDPRDVHRSSRADLLQPGLGQANVSAPAHAECPHAL